MNGLHTELTGADVAWMAFYALLTILVLAMALGWVVYFRMRNHGRRIRKIEDDTPKAGVRKLHEIGGNGRKRDGTHD